MAAIDAFRDSFQQLGNGVPTFLRTLRERAFTQFGELGFPSPRDEDWKYTSLAALERQSFQLAPAAEAEGTALAGSARLGAGVELVFVNGGFAPALSRLAALPAGVVAGSLAEALRSQPGLLESHLGSCIDSAQDGVIALNTAFVRDGAFVFVPDNVAVDLPIHCLFVASAPSGTVAHPRNLIVAGSGSRVTIIEHYLGPNGAAYWTNTVSEAVLGTGAELTHVRLQREGDQAFHLGTVAACQAADSRFVSHALTFGAALSRAAIDTRFDAAGAGCVFDGLYVAGGAQHVDHHTSIDHREPRGTSRELYKGIMDGRATGVFNGKVTVRIGAQQTDAQQMNKNLLLSDDAQIDTKPQLEIFADDVKCSHGATIGQLDDDAVFYLRARGLDEPTARALLIHAFANELIERTPVEPLRALLGRELDARLSNTLPREVQP